MVTPTFADYVELLLTLFERFWQQAAARSHRGRPFVYQQKALIVFFVVMQQRRLFRFKAQHRWLQHHPDLRQYIGLPEVPNRTTLSRRYKDLYPVLQDFVAFLGQYAEDLDPQFTSQDLYTDKSLCKAQGPVWHQSDRQAGRNSRQAPPPRHGCLLEQKRVSRLGLWLWPAPRRQSGRLSQMGAD